MSGVITTRGDRDPIAVSARGKHLVVDIHAHLGIPAKAKLVEEQYPGPPPSIGDFANAKTGEVNRAQFAAIGRTLTGVEQRLIDMNRLGVEVQALSPIPAILYFTNPETGRDASRAINDSIAAAWPAIPIASPAGQRSATGCRHGDRRDAPLRDQARSARGRSLPPTWPGSTIMTRASGRSSRLPRNSVSCCSYIRSALRRPIEWANITSTTRLPIRLNRRLRSVT